MTPPTQTAPSREAFARLGEPHRLGLRRHCYRMLGGLQDADDLVQETYLRAWRGYDGYSGGSFRAWLYAIATRACLDEITRRKGKRRWLPDRADPGRNGAPDFAPHEPWIEPFPDVMDVADEADGPEARYAAREGVQLAFVAAIQELPPRSRAALLLCDVLGWPAAEAAATLGATVGALNSNLQRARKTMADRYGASRSVEAPTGAQRELLSRYLSAWESHDMDALVATLREDARCTMPPWRLWLPTRVAIGTFFRDAWRSCSGLRLRPVTANAQPGFAAYQRRSDGEFSANALHVLTLEGDKIARMSLFLDEGPLFASFGLPVVMAEPSQTRHT